MSFWNFSTNKSKHADILIDPYQSDASFYKKISDIRTNIQFQCIDRPLNRLAISSIGMGKDSSVLSANLAITWSMIGKKVLLVDAVSRGDNILKTTFELKDQGLSDVFEKGLKLYDLVQSSGIENFDIITSGSDLKNLNNMDRFRDIISTIDTISNNYDLVILSLPSLLEMTDSHMLLSDMDGIILDIVKGLTKKDDMQQILKLLKVSRANLLGYVMDDRISDK